ncbi:hypothetical protein [Paraburkholderia translucens]|uniref:hypothetical protein n=1 Tax=Paraburkholderia translucens TaxID=2886945 RepID=UPI001E49A26B|nr:hypothetical protein [Paraburkholderia sp. MMS20-SJTN17]
MGFGRTFDAFIKRPRSSRHCLGPRLDFLERVTLFDHLARHIGPINFGESDVREFVICGYVEPAEPHFTNAADIEEPEWQHGQRRFIARTEAAHCGAYRAASRLTADTVNRHHDLVGCRKLSSARGRREDVAAGVLRSRDRTRHLLVLPERSS